MKKADAIAVVGDGFGGLMAALVLSKLGQAVNLFFPEGSDEKKGRPIVLHDNGQRALATVGLRSHLEQGHVLGDLSLNILDHDKVAGLTFDDDCPWLPSLSIDSKLLRSFMIEAAIEMGVQVHRGAPIQSAWVEEERVYVSLGSGDNHHFSAIILDDGPHSKLRSSMGFQGVVEPLGGDWVWGTSPFELPQVGVRETIAPNHTRLVTFPMGDGSTAFYFTVPTGSWPQIRDKRLEAFIQSWKPFGSDIVKCLEAVEDWSQVGCEVIMAVDLATWFKPPAFVLGEGAHAMQSFIGWGESAAMVDALVLAQLLVRGAKIKVEMADIGQTWENIRRPFVIQTQALSRQLLSLADLTSAPARLLRDALLPLAQRTGFIGERFERLIIGHYPLEEPYFNAIEGDE